MAKWKKILLVIGFIVIAVGLIKGILFWQKASMAFKEAKRVMGGDFAKELLQLQTGKQMTSEQMKDPKTLVSITENSPAFKEVKRAVGGDFAKEIYQLQTGKQMTSDQIMALQAISSIAKNPKTSFFGVVLSAGIGWQVIKDKQITAREEKALYLIRDELLKKDGKLGFFESAAFINQHPVVLEVVEALAKGIPVTQYLPNSGDTRLHSPR